MSEDMNGEKEMPKGLSVLLMVLVLGLIIAPLDNKPIVIYVCFMLALLVAPFLD